MAENGWTSGLNFTCAVWLQAAKVNAKIIAASFLSMIPPARKLRKDTLGGASAQLEKEPLNAIITIK